MIDGVRDLQLQMLWAPHRAALPGSNPRSRETRR